MTGVVLIVSHFYPPSGMVAARRPSAFAKELVRLGYDVEVLTSRAWGEGAAPGKVVRTGDLMTSRLNYRRGNLDAWTGRGEASDYDDAISLPARLIVPDVALLTWLRTPRRPPCASPASGRSTRHHHLRPGVDPPGRLALRRRGAPLGRRPARRLAL